MTIEQDDFANWREHPVTIAFIAHLKEREQHYKDVWWHISWECEKVDAVQLADLKGCATTMAYVCDLGYEDLFPKEEK
jgi:hypothetical protein